MQCLSQYPTVVQAVVSSLELFLTTSQACLLCRSGVTSLKSVTYQLQIQTSSLYLRHSVSASVLSLLLLVQQPKSAVSYFTMSTLITAQSTYLQTSSQVSHLVCLRRLSMHSTTAQSSMLLAFAHVKLPSASQLCQQLLRRHSLSPLVTVLLLAQLLVIRWLVHGRFLLLTQLLPLLHTIHTMVRLVLQASVLQLLCLITRHQFVQLLVRL